MFWKKKKTKLELLREAALDHAHDALETAQEVLHQASGAVHGTLEHAPEKLEDFKSGAGESLGDAVARVSSAVAALGSRVGDAAHSAKQGAQHQLSHAGEFAVEHAEDTRHAVEEKRRQLAKTLSRKQRDAQKKKEEVKEGVLAHIPEITVVEGNQKWIWLGAGILIGAALGVLLAPSSGRRNRAAIRNQAAKGAHKVEDLGDAAARKARDLSNKAEGVAHTVVEKVSAKYNGDSDDADDITIADRVRTALGHLPEAHALERINVDSSDGVVTLRGPVVDAATQAALIAAVGQVAGVREVVSDLLVEDDTEDTFVG